MINHDEKEAEKKYYRKTIIESFEKSLKDGILISLEDIEGKPNNYELGEFVRKKFNEKQEYIKKQIEKLKIDNL